MTRDEALRIAHEKWTKGGTQCSESIVDILTSFGILKLDEPKTVFDEVWEIIRAHTGTTYCQAIMRELDAGGFKIVRK